MTSSYYSEIEYSGVFSTTFFIDTSKIEMRGNKRTQQESLLPRSFHVERTARGRGSNLYLLPRPQGKS